MIRPMEETDIEQVCEIKKICLKETEGPAQLKKSASYDYNCYYVAVKEEKVVGFVAYSYVLDEGDIQDIAVLPEYQSQKLGTKMLCKVIKLCKKQGVTKLTLEVRSSNQKAISLYQQFDFKEIALRKNYYKNPTEDAIIMQKSQN